MSSFSLKAVFSLSLVGLVLMNAGCGGGGNNQGGANPSQPIPGGGTNNPTGLKAPSPTTPYSGSAEVGPDFGSDDISTFGGGGNWDSFFERLRSSSTQERQSDARPPTFGTSNFRLRHTNSNSDFDYLLQGHQSDSDPSSPTTTYPTSSTAPSVWNVRHPEYLATSQDRQIVISGNGFHTDSTVTLAGLNCPVSSVNSSSITCTAPRNTPAGYQTLIVTNPDGGGTSSYNISVNREPRPSITGLSPTSFLTSETSRELQIFGSNFSSSPRVEIDDQTCTNVRVNSNHTQITCTAPRLSGGTVANVTVINSNEEESAPFTLRYLAPPVPVIRSLNPTSIIANETRTLIVRGQNFTRESTIRINGVDCPVTQREIYTYSDSTLSCLAPRGEANTTARVVVRNGDGSESLASLISYTRPPAPSIHSISPDSAYSNGSSVNHSLGSFTSSDNTNILTITGSNFTPLSTVTIDGKACPRAAETSTLSWLTPNTSTQIRCTIPRAEMSVRASETRRVNVVVTNPDGQVSASEVFTYHPLPAPYVTSQIEQSGVNSGGSTIQISGLFFERGASVRLGSLAGTNVVVNNNGQSLSFMTPAGIAGMSYNIVIENPDGQTVTAGRFTYLAPAPSITMLNPTSGSTDGGTILRIHGRNFTRNSTVTMGSFACTPVRFISAELIECTTSNTGENIGHGAEGFSVTVLVTSDGQSSNGYGSEFQYTRPPAPAVSGLSLDRIFIGSAEDVSLTVRGDYFRTGATVALVPRYSSLSIARPLVCANPRVSSFLDNDVKRGTLITCTLPSYSTPSTFDVVVTNPNSQQSLRSATFTFEAAPAPEITSVIPAELHIVQNGPSGNRTLTVTGSNFREGVQVWLGQTQCTNVRLEGSSRITCTVGRGRTGRATLTVINPDTQRVDRAGLFAFTGPQPPSIAGVSPYSGPASGGPLITLFGENLERVNRVTIGNIDCTELEYNSTDHAVRCRLGRYDRPITGDTYVHVVAYDTDGQPSLINRLEPLFYYKPVLRPTVEEINPIIGIVTGGTQIKISGTDFLNNIEVTIGGLPCSNIVVEPTGTELTCITPAARDNATGPVQVVVTNPTQTPATPKSFIYIPDPNNVEACVTFANSTHSRILTSASSDIQTATQIGAQSFQRALNRIHSEDYRVNYSYIQKDPYLHRYDFDINQVYPNEITTDDLRAMKEQMITQALKKPDIFRQAQLATATSSDYGRNKLETALDYVFLLDSSNLPLAANRTSAADRQNLFKRIKRLYDKKRKLPEDRSTDTYPLGDFALLLANNYITHRCIDGVRESISRIEEQEFGQHSEPANAGEFISRVFTEYKIAFLNQHQQLFSRPLLYEFRTNTSVALRRKMHFLLNLPGTPPTVAFPSYGLPNELPLRADVVMNRFLFGERVAPYREGRDAYDTDVSIDSFAPRVEFRAFDINHMIDLLQESRERGFASLSSVTNGNGSRFYYPEKTGIRLTNDILSTFIRDDASLQFAFDTPANREEAETELENANEELADLDDVSGLRNQLMAAQEKLDRYLTQLGLRINPDDPTQYLTSTNEVLGRVPTMPVLESGYNNIILISQIRGKINLLTGNIARASSAEGAQARQDAIIRRDQAQRVIDGTVTRFFLPKPEPREGQSEHPDLNFRLTREFWMYLLDKYGYIVPTGY